MQTVAITQKAISDHDHSSSVEGVIREGRRDRNGRALAL